MYVEQIIENSMDLGKFAAVIILHPEILSSVFSLKDYCSAIETLFISWKNNLFWGNNAYNFRGTFAAKLIVEIIWRVKGTKGILRVQVSKCTTELNAMFGDMNITVQPDLISIMDKILELKIM